MSFKRRKVVMLPTNKKASCLSKDSYGRLYFGNYPKETPFNQHLYILSDEKIEVGDCCLLDWEGNGNEKDIRIGRVLRVSTNKIQITNQYGNESHCDLAQFKNSYWKKIITSTDKLLNLPELSQGFVEKYVSEYNKGNIITEVLIEYHNMGFDILAEFSYHTSLLKVSKDNTITIKKVKDSWSREEVENLLHAMYSDITTESTYDGSFYDKWIEENL